MKKWIKVTIDGPSASGKSTIAKMLATKLGFTHLDTGAIYRALALFYRDRGLLDKSEQEQQNELSFFSYYFTGMVNKKRHYLCGKDITEQIRQRDVSDISSLISSKSFIREYATNIQRMLAEDQNIVVEGRDTGSVVFPEAEVKFYLDADPIERAKRRFKELKDKRGYEGLTEDQIIDDLQKRDLRDCTRKHSPLVCPESATKLDTTNLKIPEIVEILSKKIKEHAYLKSENNRYIFKFKGKKCSFMYILFRSIFFLYFKIFHNFKVYGLENFETNSPAIIASNHVSFLDPPMIACACPQVIYGLARKSLFRNPIIKWWLLKVNSLPLTGASGDKEMIKKVIGMLLKGEKIIIFPEGTRSEDGKLQPLKKGLALLADKGSAKIIPTAVIGAHLALPKYKKFPRLFKKVAVAFGPPIYYTDILKQVGDKKKAREVFLEKVEEEIQKLLDKYNSN
jgi:cytidylate kinase